MIIFLSFIQVLQHLYKTTWHEASRPENYTCNLRGSGLHSDYSYIYNSPEQQLGSGKAGRRSRVLGTGSVHGIRGSFCCKPGTSPFFYSTHIHAWTTKLYVLSRSLYILKLDLCIFNFITKCCPKFGLSQNLPALFVCLFNFSPRSHYIDMIKTALSAWMWLLK